MVVSLKTSAVQNGGGGNNLKIEASRWQYHKFKDMFHFYAMVAAIPFTAIIICCNIFIGPAKLAPIPEGYEPKHWEYHRVSSATFHWTNVIKLLRSLFYCKKRSINVIFSYLISFPRVKDLKDFLVITLCSTKPSWTYFNPCFFLASDYEVYFPLPQDQLSTGVREVHALPVWRRWKS